MPTRTSDSHVIAALVKYAQTLDAASSNAAIDVYKAWGKTVESQDRLLLCQAMNDTIKSHQGHGFEALLPFIVVDPDPQVVANAALKTAVLFPARNSDHLEGPRFVVRLTKVRENPKRCGAILGGLMLLGDERLTPLIHETWDRLPSESRMRSQTLWESSPQERKKWASSMPSGSFPVGRLTAIRSWFASISPGANSPQRLSTVLIIYA